MTDTCPYSLLNTLQFRDNIASKTVKGKWVISEVSELPNYTEESGFKTKYCGHPEPNWFQWHHSNLRTVFTLQFSLLLGGQNGEIK